MNTIWPVEAAAQVFLQPLLSSAEMFWACSSRTWTEELPETWTRVHQSNLLSDPSRILVTLDQGFVSGLIRPKIQVFVFYQAFSFHMAVICIQDEALKSRVPSVSSLWEIFNSPRNCLLLIFSRMSRCIRNDLLWFSVCSLQRRLVCWRVTAL